MRRREGKPAFFLIVVFAAAVLAGCAGQDFAALQPGLDERGHYIEGVPFFRQGESSCGPAALASIVSFWGQRVQLDEIIAKVYLPDLRGTLPMDMERYLRNRGFMTTTAAGTLDGLKAQIRRNVPVICLLDLGLGLYRKPHYVTAIGFDDGHKAMIVHDGITPNKVIAYERFLKEWNRGGNWMLVAVPGISLKR